MWPSQRRHCPRLVAPYKGTKVTSPAEICTPWPTCSLWLSCSWLLSLLSWYHHILPNAKIGIQYMYRMYVQNIYNICTEYLWYITNIIQNIQIVGFLWVETEHIPMTLWLCVSITFTLRMFHWWGGITCKLVINF